MFYELPFIKKIVAFIVAGLMMLFITSCMLAVASRTIQDAIIAYSLMGISLIGAVAFSRWSVKDGKQISDNP